jgi:putative hemolysin
MWIELLLIVALVALNGFLAGAEIAVVAVGAARVAELAKEHARGRSLAALRRDPERFLATVQIGITTVSAAAAAFGGATIAARLAGVLESFGLSHELATDGALVAVVAAISYLSLVAGELVPKSIALKWAERYAMLAAPVLDALGRVAGPLVRVLTASSNLVLRWIGDSTSFVESQISRDELLSVLERAAGSGEVSTHATEIATRAIELDDLHAAAVMTPRVAVAGIDRAATRAQIVALLERTDEERFPVLREQEDVVGYVTTRDLGRLLATLEPFDLATIVRPVHVVPGTASALDLLATLQRRRMPIAVVVDQAGGFDGIVDVDDLAEEVVGALVDGVEAGVPGGSVVVPASQRVHVVNRRCGTALPQSRRWSTLGGLVLTKFGSIPSAGATITLDDGTTIEVLEATARRVTRVRITPAARAGAG